MLFDHSRPHTAIIYQYFIYESNLLPSLPIHYLHLECLDLLLQPVITVDRFEKFFRQLVALILCPFSGLTNSPLITLSHKWSTSLSCMGQFCTCFLSSRCLPRTQH